MTPQPLTPLTLTLLSLVAFPLAAPLGAQAPAGDAPKPPALVEKTVYVPYEKLEAVFEKEGRGIFLPYEKFLELWNAGQPKPPDPKPDDPPAAAVVRGGAYTGVVVPGGAAGDVARFTVTLDVEALKKGWCELSLPFRGVAIEQVELSSPTALFTTTPPAAGAAGPGGYSLLLQGPGRSSAKITFSTRVVQEPGRRKVALGLPPTAVSRLELVVPEADARVEVEPVLAVTQTSTVDKKTQVLAFLGNASDIAISWMPPASQAADVGAVLAAEQAVRVHLEERVLRIASDVVFQPLRGETATLKIRAPAETRLLSVRGDNIREWTQEGDLVTVRLHAPIKSAAYALSLGFERILESTPATLAVPFPRVEDVIRESGWVILSHETGLNVRIARSQALSQLDPAEVPEGLRPGLGTGFRYLAHPLALELAVEKILPVVRASVVSVVVLGQEEDAWHGWVDYNIARAGLFRLELRVPQRWSVSSIGDPATFESTQPTDADGQRTITVNLKAKALGAFRLPFKLTAQGSAAAGESVHAPPVVLGTVEDRGLFGVSAPRAFEASTAQRERMTSADVDELFRTGVLAQVGAQTGIPLVYSYREQPASVRIALVAKKTQVDLLAQHLIEIEDGGIRATHFLDFEILYAATDRISFSAPSSLDSLLKVEAKEKKEVRRGAAAAGVTTWEMTLQAPIVGVVAVTLSHELDLKALQSGQPFAYAVPIIHAADAAAGSEKGFVAVRKEGTLEVAPQATGLEAIDAGDLPDKLRRGQIYSAFRYFARDPALSLTLTRYEHRPLATAVVNLIRARSVLSPEGRLVTHAVLFVQNTERQYLALGLPANASILSLAVAGKSQQPRKRKDGPGTLVQIPAGTGTTFPVEAVYEETLDSGAFGATSTASLRTLEVLDGVPVSKIELDLHLPPDREYLGFSGTLHERDPQQPTLWTRFKALLDGGGQAGMLVPPAGGPAPPAAPAGGVQIELHTRGTLLRLFETMAPIGELSFRQVTRGLFTVLDFAAFALAAAAGVALLARKRWPPYAVAGLLVLAPLVLTWLLRGPAGELATSLLAGSVLAVLIAAFLGLRRWVARRRAVRLALAPDPFLEEAGKKPTAVAPPAPPGDGGAAKPGAEGPHAP